MVKSHARRMTSPSVQKRVTDAAEVPETDATPGSSMRKPVINFPLFWIML